MRLSNWEILRLDDFGRPIDGACMPPFNGPCGWAAWDQLGRDPAIGSSVMITAVTDSGGFFIFLGLATLILVHR